MTGQRRPLRAVCSLPLSDRQTFEFPVSARGTPPEEVYGLASNVHVCMARFRLILSR